MSRRRPHLAGRLLAHLLGSHEAETLRGDLDEAFARDPKHGYVSNVFRSVLAWWSPGAVLRRRRMRRRRADDQGRASRMTLALFNEFRYAVRNLVRRPLYSASVAITLALGIGFVTAIFSVVDAVLIRPLPYAHADRLVAVGATFPDREWRGTAGTLQQLAGVSVANYVDWRARSRSFESLAAVEPTTLMLPLPTGGSDLVRSAAAAPGFFALFSGPARVGRLLDEDDLAGRNGRVAMLSYGAWVRRYGADPDVVGGTPRPGAAMNIVGVLPPDFRQPEVLGRAEIEFWMPLDPSLPRYTERSRRSAYLFGLLRRGVTIEAARTELASVQSAVATEFPDGNVYPDGKRLGAGVNSLQAEVVGGSGATLWIFLAASATLLLIAGLNTANLLFVRCLDRQSEIGVRRALGAGSGAIVGGLLIESLLLAATAGVLGVMLAFTSIEAFLQLAPTTLPRLEEVAVNLRILGAAAAVSLGTGMLVGLVPAMHLTRGDLTATIRGAVGHNPSQAGHRVRHALVVGQIALAVLLLVGASLLINSYVRLRSVDPGFQPGGILVFSMPLKRPGADPALPMWQHWDELRRHVEGVPGVSGVALTSNVPFQSPNWAPWVLLPTDPRDSRRTGVAGYAVTPGYLDTMRIPLSAGRGFVASDGPLSTRVAIVNDAFVDAYLRDRDAVGETIQVRGDDDTITEMTVVGVAANVVQSRPEEGWLPAIYVPYTQTEWPAANVVMRSERPLDALGADLRRAVAPFTPVPITDLAAMTGRIDRLRMGPRFNALLVGTFASVALLLAAIGLHATVAHSVKRRTREIGIRMAVGADRARIFRMVFLEGLAISALGLSIGVVAAALLSPIIRGFVFQIDALDPATFVAASTALAAVVALALARSAMHAMRVGLAASLKSD